MRIIVTLRIYPPLCSCRRSIGHSSCDARRLSFEFGNEGLQHFEPWDRVRRTDPKPVQHGDESGIADLLGDPVLQFQKDSYRCVLRRCCYVIDDLAAS